MSQLQILSSLGQSPAHQAIQAEDFFAREILIHSPLLLPDMERAVEMLQRRQGAFRGEGGASSRAGQRVPESGLHAGGAEPAAQSTGVDEGGILIAGDRDVDGVTSTVLLTDFLRRWTESTVDYINSSEGDDYGLTGSFFERMRESPAGLVILLDMGSAHLEQALSLVEAGKEVVILDHHIPQISPDVADRLHQLAFVNPRRYERANEMGHQGKIATAGLAFKLILALRMRHTELWDRLFRVDLEQENRAVLYRGGAFVAEGSAEWIDQMLAVQQEQQTSRGRLPGKMYRTTVDGLGDICAVFRERPASDWYKMIRTTPVEFGRYLFACSILHRQDLLQCVVQECDLASIGLVADLVPLVGENRRMVALGLGRERRRFAREKGFPVESMVRPGLLALFRETGLDPMDLRTRDINFTVNPLINAAGRMGQTEKALELLLCRDPLQARQLAADLQRLNGIRRERTEQNHRIVSTHLELNESDRVVFFYHPELQPGISGLMATRLLESTGKPVVWVNPDGLHARGSARSRPGWNMVDLLQPLSPFLVQLGGHAEACGFTISYDRIEEFRLALAARAREYEEGRDAGPRLEERERETVRITHRQLGPSLLDELNLLEPFGPENPEPEFSVDGVEIRQAAVMKKGVHLRFSVSGCLSDVEFVYWNCPPDLRLAVLESQADGTRTLQGNVQANAYAGGSANRPCRWRLTGYFEKNRIPRMKPLRFRLTAMCESNPSDGRESDLKDSASEVIVNGGVGASAGRDPDALAGDGLLASGL